MALHWDPEQFVQRMRERNYRALLDDPPECSLSELRKSCHKSQAEVASSLGVRQLAVSRMERSRNVRLGTLSVYVAALGGHLELTVRFPRRAVRLKGYVIALQPLEEPCVALR